MAAHQEETGVKALQLVYSLALPMTLKTAIDLDLFELIKKAGRSVSASDLVSQISIVNPDASMMIDRILALLTAHSVLDCTVSGTERRYSISPVGMFFTKNEDGVSLAPMAFLNQNKICMESWYHLKDAIVEGGTPFNKAHGMSAFEFFATKPNISKLFNQAMSDHSTIIMKKILETYKGFEGLKSLVDVGGGIGATLNMIISKYPSTKGINFDLPYVIQEAPSYLGVEHIGGDMFDRVPKADAIFMKSICHNWNDEYCKKLFKNCYEALPAKNGKVIVAEYILPEDPNSGRASPDAFQADVIMLVHHIGAKERTEKEFQTLAYETGFKKFRKVCCAFNIWIMEFYK